MLISAKFIMNLRYGECANIFGEAKVTTELPGLTDTYLRIMEINNTGVVRPYKSRLKSKEQTKRAVAIAINNLNLGS